MERVALSVPDVHCEGCTRTIQEALGEMPGVGRVTTDLQARQIMVEFDSAQTNSTTIRDRVERAGFPATIVSERERRLQPPPPPTPAPGHRYALLVLVAAVLALAGYVGYELYPRFNLPAAEGIGLLLLAAGAGIASFFSPCAFPLLVTLLARETGVNGRSAWAPSRVGPGLAFATALSVGAALFLAFVGMGIALGGGVLFAGVTFTSPAGRAIRIGTGIVLIALGLVQLGVLPNPLHAVEVLARPLQRAQARYRRRRRVLGFGVFGFGYLLAGFG
ncbi:MAG: cation transporter [Vicinamibacteraceae bacterium]